MDSRNGKVHNSAGSLFLWLTFTGSCRLADNRLFVIFINIVGVIIFANIQLSLTVSLSLRTHICIYIYIYIKKN